MKTFGVCGLLLLFAAAASAGPCLPGSMTDFVLGGGCDVYAVHFSDFELASGFAPAIPINPDLVQVTPGGTPTNPSLFFTLNSTALAGEVFELFFRFNATGSRQGVSISLGSPSVTLDGAVTGVLDV